MTALPASFLCRAAEIVGKSSLGQSEFSATGERIIHLTKRHERGERVDPKPWIRAYRFGSATPAESASEARDRTRGNPPGEPSNRPRPDLIVMVAIRKSMGRAVSRAASDPIALPSTPVLKVLQQIGLESNLGLGRFTHTGLVTDDGPRDAESETATRIRSECRRESTELTEANPPRRCGPNLIDRDAAFRSTRVQLKYVQGISAPWICVATVRGSTPHVFVTDPADI